MIQPIGRPTSGFEIVLVIISEHSVQSLEAQISELESECARLSRAFETQKAAAHEAELVAKRKSDEAAKEINTRVIHSRFLHVHD